LSLWQAYHRHHPQCFLFSPSQFCISVFMTLFVHSSRVVGQWDHIVPLRHFDFESLNLGVAFWLAKRRHVPLRRIFTVTLIVLQYHLRALPFSDPCTFLLPPYIGVYMFLAPCLWDLFPCSVSPVCPFLRETYCQAPLTSLYPCVFRRHSDPERLQPHIRLGTAGLWKPIHRSHQHLPGQSGRVAVLWSCGSRDQRWHLDCYRM
jgi:hypothetical protein